MGTVLALLPSLLSAGPPAARIGHRAFALTHAGYVGADNSSQDPAALFRGL
jgi:hypothetical protein